MKNFWSESNIDIYNLLCPLKVDKCQKKYRKFYDKEQVIYFENAIDEKIYLVSKGKVKLVNYDEFGNEIIQYILLKGSLFGENCVLGDYKHNEFAVAACNKTCICSIDKNTLQQLMTDKDFAAAIFKYIAFRRKKTNRRIELLIGKDVNARIAAYIIDLYKDSENLNIKKSLTQAEIGKLLATSRESVVRVFNDLKDKGIIDYSRSAILIRDLPVLMQMSKAS